MLKKQYCMMEITSQAKANELDTSFTHTYMYNFNP